MEESGGDARKQASSLARPCGRGGIENQCWYHQGKWNVLRWNPSRAFQIVSGEVSLEPAMMFPLARRFSKQLPPEKIRLASRDAHAEAAKSARVLTSTKYTQYTRNPDIKITYDVPEYRDESAAAAAKDQRSTSIADDRGEEGVLPTPFLYIGLLVSLVLSVVLSGFMVPYGLKYGYEANVAWFKSLIVAIFLNNIVIDLLKSVGVTGYVASRKKK